MQKQWSWCNKCQGLFFLGNPSNGVCQRGGEHDPTGSGHYVAYGESEGRNNAQPGWRWCRKCQGMYFAGNGTGGSCPAGGEHDGAFSGPYTVDYLSVVRLDFQPSRHGFHFVNNFINNVSPGITTYGLCGGMSLAAARYWLNNVPIPPQTSRDFPDGTPPGVPPVGSVLHGYIYGCQLASFGPLGIISAANWIIFPHVTWDDQFRWSVSEFANVQRRTNEGIPTVLGLRRREGGPMGHQVLAYGYDANDSRLYVYDPNFPDVEKCLRLNHATRRIEYDGGGSPEWSSYFVTGCSVEGGPPPS